MKEVKGRRKRRRKSSQWKGEWGNRWACLVINETFGLLACNSLELDIICEKGPLMKEIIYKGFLDLDGLNKESNWAQMVWVQIMKFNVGKMLDVIHMKAHKNYTHALLKIN